MGAVMMKRGGQWLIGLMAGAAMGAVLATIFAPVTGKAFRQRLRKNYDETLAEAQQAGREREQELEARLARLQKRA
jgi:gas vesicle protein